MSEILFGLKRKNCEADNDTSRQKEGLQDNGYVVERDKDSDGIRLNNSLECKIIYLYEFDVGWLNYYLYSIFYTILMYSTHKCCKKYQVDWTLSPFHKKGD